MTTSNSYVHDDKYQHAFDPYDQPRLFDSVRSRRFVAYLLDIVAIFLLSIPVAVLVFVLGIFTLGAAWLLYGTLFPLVAIAYSAFTLGGPDSATPGMKAMGLQMRLWYGPPMYPLLAAMHLLAFYFSMAILTPLVLIVALLNDRKRLLHDILLGTVVISTSR